MNTPNKIVTHYPVETAMLNIYTHVYSDQLIDESVGINYFTLEPLVFHSFTSDVGEYSIATKIHTENSQHTFLGTHLTEQMYSDSSKCNKIKNLYANMVIKTRE